MDIISYLSKSYGVISPLFFFSIEWCPMLVSRSFESSKDSKFLLIALLLWSSVPSRKDLFAVVV